MNSRLFAILLFGGTIFSVVGWLTIIFFIDPTRGSTLTFFVFYFLLFTMLIGIFFGLGNGLRQRLVRKKMPEEKLRISFRQALFFSALLTGGAFLQSQHLLNWVNTLLLIIVLTLFEFFFLASNRSRRPLYDGGEQTH